MPHIHDKYDFTVSMFLLHPTKQEICMHWHKKLGFWNNFGGHIELDQDPLECLHQEMKEETGLSPDEYRILQTHDAPKNIGVKEMPSPFSMHLWKYGELEHYHIDLPYILRAKHTNLCPQEGESQDIAWFDMKKIRDYHKQGKIDTGTKDICEWIFAQDL